MGNGSQHGRRKLNTTHEALMLIHLYLICILQVRSHAGYFQRQVAESNINYTAQHKVCTNSLWRRERTWLTTILHWTVYVDTAACLYPFPKRSLTLPLFRPSFYLWAQHPKHLLLVVLRFHGMPEVHHGLLEKATSIFMGFPWIIGIGLYTHAWC